ncbi:MAG: hypothetical protein IPI93_11355 [Sphingobacteriaceae bacterium]|nr:hypothetical protein [Sphingobacteriaceae bacterium]
MKELLDDGALDPKKFFDKDNYNTLTIALNNGKEQYKEKDIDVLIGLLDPEITREDKETKLAIVKDNKLHHLIIKAVVEAENDEDRAKLLCICWESGLDFMEHFLFFIEQACDPDFQVALEAYTAAENIENVRDEEILTRAILMIEDCKSGQKQILEDLKSNILSRRI